MPFSGGLISYSSPLHTLIPGFGSSFMVAPCSAKASMWSTLRRAHKPSFYDEVPRRGATLAGACAYIFFISFILSLPQTLFFLARVLPTVADLRWRELARGAVEIFPAGLELVLNDTELSLRPSRRARRASADFRASGHAGPDGAPTAAAAAADSLYVCWEEGRTSWCAAAAELEPIRITFNPLLYDLCYTDLPAPLLMPPAKLFKLFWTFGHDLFELADLKVGEAEL